MRIPAFRRGRYQYSKRAQEAEYSLDPDYNTNNDAFSLLSESRLLFFEPNAGGSHLVLGQGLWDDKPDQHKEYEMHQCRNVKYWEDVVAQASDEAAYSWTGGHTYEHDT